MPTRKYIPVIPILVMFLTRTFSSAVPLDLLKVETRSPPRRDSSTPTFSTLVLTEDVEVPLDLDLPPVETAAGLSERSY
jgi:hypothetical protein